MSSALDPRKSSQPQASLQVFVEAIGVAAPGLADWQVARAVLRGEQAFLASELPPYQPLRLPANERRRATPAVRQAFRAAEDAIAHSACDPAELATVFASSDADMNVLHRICSALAEPARVVSPTDFHNSVHNAAAGYWSIAVGARRNSISIGAYDSTAAAGLLEAATLLLDEAALLLVLYDVPQPKPLFDQHPIVSAVSVALVLTRTRSAGTRAALRLTLADSADDVATTLADPQLEALRRANPAARLLPLLRVLAQQRNDSVLLEAVAGRCLRIDIESLA
ncbi:MAG: hypothetical protein JWR16_1586 [Nevskia sp.]|nr:hypothetical protein [Nevskia sp.]